MLTLLRSLGVAALALAIPAFAQAAPLIRDGETDVFPGIEYEYDETLGLLAGTNIFSFGFTPYGTPADAFTVELSMRSGGLTFGNFEIAGPGGPFGYTDFVAGPGGLSFAAAIIGAALEVGEEYDLILTFDLANNASTQVNVQMEVIPLPAAGLLLLGGLGGLGLVARRRKSTEA